VAVKAGFKPSPNLAMTSPLLAVIDAGKAGEEDHAHKARQIRGHGRH